MGRWGDAWEWIKDAVDPFDVTGQDAAAQATKDNAANLAQQKLLADQAQAFFASQSAAGQEEIRKGSNLASGVLGVSSGMAQDQIDAGLAASSDALGAGRDAAMGSLASGYQTGRGDVSGGYGQARGDLSSSYGQARGDLERVQGLQSFTGQATGAVDGGRNQVLDQAGGLYGGFEEDPGYKFRQQQGEEAINRQAAAQGGRGGGATMKALADYNQGLASQEYGNFAQRQQAAAGLYEGQANRTTQGQLAAQSNAMGLAGMGYGAQGQLAGMAGQYGQSQAGLSAAGGESLGGMATDAGQFGAGLETQYGQDLSGANERAAGLNAGMTFGTGGALADLYANTGTSIANIGIGVGAQGVDTSKSLMGAYNDALNNDAAINQNKKDDNKETAGMIMTIA